MPPLPQQLMTVMICPLSATGATLKLILAFQRGEDAKIFSWNSEHDVLFVFRPWSVRHQDGVSPTNGSNHLQSRSILSQHRCQSWTCCLSGKRNPRNLFLTTGTDIRRSGHRLTLTEGLLLFWWCWSVCVAFKDHPFPPCLLSSTLQLSDYFQWVGCGTNSAEGVIMIKNVKHEAITSEETRSGIDLSDGFCL